MRACAWPTGQGPSSNARRTALPVPSPAPPLKEGQLRVTLGWGTSKRV